MLRARKLSAKDQRDLPSTEEPGSKGDERERVLLVRVSQRVSRVRVALATTELAKVILSRSVL